MFSAKWYDYSDTSALADSYKIRNEVFVREQGIPDEIEFDGSDDEAMFVVIYENETPCATGRVTVTDEGNMLLGRIAVSKEFRGKRYGDLVVRMLIRKCFDSGMEIQYVDAQAGAVDFYKKLGFEIVEGAKPFVKAGIEHIPMLHRGDVGTIH